MKTKRKTELKLYDSPSLKVAQVKIDQVLCGSSGLEDYDKGSDIDFSTPTLENY